jgi:molybdenum cofactor cytidylyltransferase
VSGPIVIVLASGQGARFMASGGTTHKLYARLGGKTVLQHTLDAVQASGLAWHLEDAGHPGMGDSIAAAVRATLQSGEPQGGWLILPGDLPLIQSATLRMVAGVLREHDAVVPLYQGQRGHPVGFSACCAQALAELNGNQGAAAVLRAYSAVECHVDDMGCVSDIDTLEDLQRAELRLQEG